MRTRLIRGLDRLRDAVTMIEAAFPLWSEHRRRSTRTRMVSRARHKLQEAIDTFRIPVSGATQVLDLGAAPGGWTAVLVEAGASVVAVDPGALSPAVAAHPASHICDAGSRKCPLPVFCSG